MYCTGTSSATSRHYYVWSMTSVTSSDPAPMPRDFLGCAEWKIRHSEPTCELQDRSLPPALGFGLTHASTMQHPRPEIAMRAAWTDAPLKTSANLSQFMTAETQDQHSALPSNRILPNNHSQRRPLQAHCATPRSQRYWAWAGYRLILIFIYNAGA